jgi:hypothetical protein
MVLGRRFKLYFNLCVWNIEMAAVGPPDTKTQLLQSVRNFLQKKYNNSTMFTTSNEKKDYLKKFIDEPSRNNGWNNAIGKAINRSDLISQQELYNIVDEIVKPPVAPDVAAADVAAADVAAAAAGAAAYHNGIPIMRLGSGGRRKHRTRRNKKQRKHRSRKH